MRDCVAEEQLGPTFYFLPAIVLANTATENTHGPIFKFEKVDRDQSLVRVRGALQAL